MSTTLPSYLGENPKINPKVILQRYSITGNRESTFFFSLCAKNQPIIPYKEALLITETSEEPATFYRLVEKFESAQLMVMRTFIEKDILRPQYIRMTDEDSQIFFSEYITEQIHRLFVSSNINQSLITINELRTNGMEIPRSMLIPVNNEHFLDAYSQKENINIDTIEDFPIYTINISNEQHFLCTKTILPQICDLSISKLQTIAKSDNSISALSHIINIPVAMLRDYIRTDDFVQWQDIANRCHEKIEGIINDTNISVEMQDYIILLYTSITPKAQYLKNREHIKQLIDTFIINMLRVTQQYEEGLTTQQLNTLLHKEAQQLHFSDNQILEAINVFKEQYIISNDSTLYSINLKEKSIIFQMNDIYLNSNNLIKIISENFLSLSDQLKQFYVQELYKYLTNKLSPSQIIFFSEDDLESSVHQKVKEFDPSYANILRNPLLLANIISNSKKSTTTNQFDEMSTSKKLALFFNLNTKKILPWYIIFNVRLNSFIEEAYRRLSIFRKILLIFTGRYRNVQTKINRIQEIEHIHPNMIKFNMNSPNTKLNSDSSTTEKTIQNKHHPSSSSKDSSNQQKRRTESIITTTSRKHKR